MSQKPWKKCASSVLSIHLFFTALMKLISRVHLLKTTRPNHSSSFTHPCALLPPYLCIVSPTFCYKWKDVVKLLFRFSIGFFMWKLPLKPCLRGLSYDMLLYDNNEVLWHVSVFTGILTSFYFSSTPKCIFRQGRYRTDVVLVENTWQN